MFISAIFARLLLKNQSLVIIEIGNAQSVEKYIVRLAELNLSASKTRIRFYQCLILKVVIFSNKKLFLF